MNRLLLTLFLSGCATAPAASLTPDTQQAARVEFAAALSQIDGTAREQLTAVKEQTSLLADIKTELQKLTQEASGDDPTTPENGKAVIPESTGEAGTTAKDSDEAGPPVLHIGYAPFHCPPCEDVKTDIAAGKFSDFAIEYDIKPGTEKGGYPILRWKKPDGLDKWVNGYGPGTLATIKKELLGTKNLVASQEIVYQPEPVRQATVKITAGPTWTWPGSLYDHLPTMHGVDVAGMSFDEMRAVHDSIHNGQRGFQAAMPTRRVQYVRRSGSYCPGGNCP